MITIGAFSRMGQISVRMLRHYDAIGLLKPVHVDPETGYRYYEEKQLQTLRRIETLKQYHFPLARIVELLALEEDALNAVLHEKRLALYRETAHLQETLRRLDTSIGLMEGKIMANEQTYKVTVMDVPEQRIFGITRTIHIGQVDSLFAELRNEMAVRSLTRAGASMMIYHGEAFNYDDMDVEAAYPVKEDHPDTRMMAGGPMVCTIHHGAYEGLPGAYEAIGKWMGENGYEIAGPGYERYIRDEQDGVPPDAFETGILFPVKRA